jgi:hypothetical protein
VETGCRGGHGSPRAVAPSEEYHETLLFIGVPSNETLLFIGVAYHETLLHRGRIPRDATPSGSHTTRRYSSSESQATRRYSSSGSHTTRCYSTGVAYYKMLLFMPPFRAWPPHPSVVGSDDVLMAETDEYLVPSRLINRNGKFPHSLL